MLRTVPNANMVVKIKLRVQRSAGQATLTCRCLTKATKPLRVKHTCVVHVYTQQNTQQGTKLCKNFFLPPMRIGREKLIEKKRIKESLPGSGCLACSLSVLHTNNGPCASEALAFHEHLAFPVVIRYTSSNFPIAHLPHLSAGNYSSQPSTPFSPTNRCPLCLKGSSSTHYAPPFLALSHIHSRHGVPVL